MSMGGSATHIPSHVNMLSVNLVKATSSSNKMVKGENRIWFLKNLDKLGDTKLPLDWMTCGQEMYIIVRQSIHFGQLILDSINIECNSNHDIYQTNYRITSI